MKYGKFLSGIRDAQITCFFQRVPRLQTLPVTMDVVHNKLGVSERTRQFCAAHWCYSKHGRN